MDSYENRIILDYDSVCKDIEDVLEEVKILRSERQFAQLLGEPQIQKLKNFDQAIHKRLYDAFSLVVVGDFKRGKSTLINSLFGKNLMPTAVTPETVTINKLSYHETPRSEAVLNNGKRMVLKQGELKREEIENLKLRLSAQIDYIDIKEDFPRLKEISIVDTPGIGDFMKVFDQQVADYLILADAILYVVSAKAPLSQSEQTFLSSAVIPQNFSCIFVVVNMIDTLENVTDIEQIEALTRRRTTNISPNLNVYMVSALDELCRKQELARPQPELSAYLESRYDEFNTALEKDILLQRDVIKSSRGISLTKAMLQDMILRIRLVESSLQANVKELNASGEIFEELNSELFNRIEKHKDNLRSEIDKMKEETNGWMFEFMMRLKQELIGCNQSMQDLERHFQFYMMDITKQGILSCIEVHQIQIADRLSAASKDFAKEIAQGFFGNINVSIADCITDVSWTNIDTTMFVANMFNVTSLLGPLYLIGQAIAGFARQRTISKRQEDFLMPVLQNYESLVLDINHNVDHIYDQLKENAVDKLDELYQNQYTASQDAIRQAKEIATREDYKTEEVTAYIESIVVVLERMKETIRKYE